MKCSPRVRILVVVVATLAAACQKSPGVSSEARPENGAGAKPEANIDTPPRAGAPLHDTDPYAAVRAHMVESQLRARDITDPLVLAAMRKVPRHEFVPEDVRPRAYSDTPLPIGERQTISQPLVVALMTQLARPRRDSRVLEVGTGSGYQAAVLAEICREVYTIEIVEPLGKRAARTLGRLGYHNVHTRIGDGYRGWPEAAPFDAIIVTAAPPHVPEPLKEQLRVGGRLVIPVGDAFQELRVITRTSTGYKDETVAAVLFVPMTGEAQK